MKDAIEIIRTLRDLGFSALLAGGCVRDRIMRREPEDYDIATDALPEQIVRIFSRTIPVGAEFGVVVVVVEGREYQVATFRSDSAYSDGRHPDRVTFSSAQEDALRRDFTINGLFYDPIEDRIIDYVGGKADIEREMIRAIGDPNERFGEDKLRMMRCVRFAARFHYRIEERTFEAIRRMAPKILQVSWERVRDELIKILTDGNAGTGIELLIRSGIMEHILPEICAMEGVKQPPRFHPEGDVLTHTLMMLDRMGMTSPTLALGVMLHDVGKPPTFEVRDRIRFNEHAEVGAKMVEEICRRLKSSNFEVEQVRELVRNHLKFMDVQNMRPSTLKRFLRTEGFEEHLELHRLDCMCSHGDLTNWAFCKRALEEMEPEEIRPKPLINGYDLIDLGYTPGPRFREILSLVEDAQLEGQIKNREEALKLIEGTFKKKERG